MSNEGMNKRKEGQKALQQHNLPQMTNWTMQLYSKQIKRQKDTNTT